MSKMADTPKYDDTTPVSYDETTPIEETPIASGPSQTEAAARGAGQGLTFGFSDEALGALQAAGSPVEIAKAPDSMAKLKQLYQQYRDIERAKNKAAEEAFPKTYLAGGVAGAFVPALIPGLGVAGAALKGTTAAGAAATGALMGLGTSQADLLGGEYGKAATDVALGAGLGAAGQKVAGKLGKIFSPDALREGAAQSAAKALGAKGMYESERSQMGKAFIEAGGLKEGVKESALGTLKSAAKKTEDTLQPMLAKAKQILSGKSAEEVEQAVGGDAGDKMYGLLQKKIDSMKDATDETINAFGENIAPKVQQYILKLKEAGNDPVRLNEIKRAINSEAADAFKQMKAAQKANQLIPQATEDWNKMASEMSGVVAQHIEDLGEAAASGLGTQIKDINKYAGGLAEARPTLSSTLRKETQELPMPLPKEMAFYPKQSMFTSALSALTEGGRLGKANAQMGLAEGLEYAGEKAAKGLDKLGSGLDTALSKVGVDKKYEAIKKAIANNISPVEVSQKAISGPQMTELVQAGREMVSPTQYVPAPVEVKTQPADSPAGISREVSEAPEAKLREIAKYLSSRPGFEGVSEKLNKALEEQDSYARNAAIVNLTSNPLITKLLKQQGLVGQK